jgi:SNF2 family DNA or RNA helicase
LKKNHSITRQTVFEKFYFKIEFDDKGALLIVVDETGKAIEPELESVSGVAREVLKSLQSIRERNLFRIDWDNPDGKIYLTENEFVLNKLHKVGNLVDSKFQLIQFAEGVARIRLEISEATDGLKGEIVLHHLEESYRQVQFLSENYVLVAEKIFQIQPVGNHFENLRLFETRISAENLDRYFTLLFSYFENIQIRYLDFQVVPGTARPTQPALVFEKVSTGNLLYLRLTRVLPGFQPDFLENYEISRIASLNELERTISVSEVLHHDLFADFEELKRLIRKYQKKIDDKKGFHIDDNLFIIEEELARAFIYQELTQLLSRFVIFGAEKLRSYQVRMVQPRLKLQLSHQIDYLEGDAELEIDGQTISLIDALKQFERKSYISLNDGTHAIINQEYLNRLQRIFQQNKGKTRVSIFDFPLLDELIGPEQTPESLQKLREIFSGFNQLQRSKVKIPELNATLRTYQKQGFKWLNYLRQNELGGCLADDMGLGKTIQAIALLATIYPKEKQCSLIVMPRSLLFNWENEITKFKPEISCYIYHGLQRDFEIALKANLILTTYATVRNDIEKFVEQEFKYVILDESQNIKNLNAQLTRAVLNLKSKHRLALSGTPLENNLLELYSLFRFLNPTMFGSQEAFAKNYITPIQKYSDKTSLLELRKKIYPFVLRRLKKDVLKELPDKIEQTLYVEMSPEQRELYEQRRQFYYATVKNQIQEQGIQRSQFFILQALNELRQIASVPESRSEQKIISPKRETLMENLLDAIANNHKVLVFANYLAALDFIAEDLEKAGIEYLLMTGATRDRKTLVDSFQQDDQYKVFLMTLKTGGIGLNLTAADYIFIFDPWWNKAAENQAVDRTHRIGQDKTVFSYKLITRQTIEEKILLLQQKKSDLFDSLITSDGASLKTLSEEDIDFVLGGEGKF